MNLKLIAHRSGTDRYPEQSRRAARFSLSQNVDFVEMDVRFTREGVPVICHDPNVERVFGVNCRVEDMSIEEFLKLKNREQPEDRTFTLDTVFEEQLVPVLLHLKCDGKDLQTVLDHIAQYNMQDKVVIGIGDPLAVAQIKAFDSRIRVLAFMHTEADMETFLSSACEFIRLWEPWLTQEKIDRVHAAGKEVLIMSGTFDTVGYTDLANLKKWARMGVQAVLINEILKAKAVLEESK